MCLLPSNRAKGECCEREEWSITKGSPACLIVNSSRKEAWAGELSLDSLVAKLLPNGRSLSTDFVGFSPIDLSVFCCRFRLKLLFLEMLCEVWFVSYFDFCIVWRRATAYRASCLARVWQQQKLPRNRVNSFLDKKAWERMCVWEHMDNDWIWP